MHSPWPRHHRARRSHSLARNHVSGSPSTSVYMIAAAATAAALFFLLWWMLQEEENPWIPAGLAASVVLLVAALARLMAARRDRTRPREHNGFAAESYSSSSHRLSSGQMHSTSLHAAALRSLQKQSAEADAKDSPEVHRE